jgi:proline iminopeptidase
LDITVDGVNIFVLSVGDERNYPLFLLHGGPGLDHTELWPWFDRMSDQFRLLYVDLRGQGRSQRVDPATLSLSRFAADVTGLAEALGLERYAVLGHSFGSFVALAHAIEQGGASHYIISGGTASFTKTAPEVEQNLATFEPIALREQVTESWALEAHAKTQEDVARLMAMQMPFHFATTESDAYRRFMEVEAKGQAIYSPEVLAYFATNAYAIEYESQLNTIHSPTLIITGEQDRTCTPRASRDLHVGIPGSDLVTLPDAGHMTFIEQPGMYFAALRDFFARHPIG